MDKNEIYKLLNVLCNAILFRATHFSCKIKYNNSQIIIQLFSLYFKNLQSFDSIYGSFPCQINTAADMATLDFNEIL
jgi:hypothetical protein